ncbi:hypothetical protein BJ944DRAFT_286511 [Cunninghamella echinulata]|nr:hypothetical protein BJ944DRAFT_286511 [Cunninghamella echinulata]
MKKQTLIVFISMLVLGCISDENIPKDDSCTFDAKSNRECVYSPTECPYDKEGKCKIGTDPLTDRLCDGIVCTAIVCAFGIDPYYCGCCPNYGCLPDPDDADNPRNQGKNTWIEPSQCPDLNFTELGWMIHKNLIEQFKFLWFKIIKSFDDKSHPSDLQHNSLSQSDTTYCRGTNSKFIYHCDKAADLVLNIKGIKQNKKDENDV